MLLFLILIMGLERAELEARRRWQLPISTALFYRLQHRAVLPSRYHPWWRGLCMIVSLFAGSLGLAGVQHCVMNLS